MKSKCFLAIFILCVTSIFQVTGGILTYDFNSGFDNSGNIPDGSVTPWSDTRTLSGITDTSITSISVKLDISGGYNGDLYGYLSYNGVKVPLINRLGVGTGNSFGYSDSGLSLTLSDSADHNVHFYQTVEGYSIADNALWKPDGRNVDPLSSNPSDFDSVGTVLLSSFNGMNPNGDWTLVLSDLSTGGGQATVTGWGMQLSAVPEPSTTGIVVGACLLGFAFLRRFQSHRQYTS